MEARFYGNNLISRDIVNQILWVSDYFNLALMAAVSFS